MKKIVLEIDYLSVTRRNIGKIVECLKKRNYYKHQINVEDFSFKTNKKLYQAIDNVNMEMKKLLETYHRKFKKEIVYKGVDLQDVANF